MSIAKPILRIAVAALCASAITAQAAQTHYPTPEDAGKAFIEAAKSGNEKAMKAVLGDDYKSLGSGDPVADRASLKNLVDAAAKGTDIAADDDRYATLLIGEDEWPLPIPMVKEEKGWRFDTAAGKEELINRYIGRDELHAIATLRALVDAQMEYRQGKFGGDGAYAQKLASSEGKKDGLYWRVDEGQPRSPLGPLAADAVEAGYGDLKGDQSVPYYGYYFRLLTAQGSSAPGGKRNYLKDGQLTGGFAAVAYPAEYGKSGIKSFIVNQRGIVFEKDLGAATRKLAEEMAAFDPDPSWEPVDDPTL